MRAGKHKPSPTPSSPVLHARTAQHPGGGKQLIHGRSETLIPELRGADQAPGGRVLILATRPGTDHPHIDFCFRMLL
ncbi:hypothetical protein E2C01_098542 [Portunus trituberculatus]|uniref:Uncharacterized protein n=1 Tax=Portunus trituberculatus TaxID=210409 RepID=A0A5B7K390_PORTR|nr:hypothetical protein [Portunus trituberculatus]